MMAKLEEGLTHDPCRPNDRLLLRIDGGAGPAESVHAGAPPVLPVQHVRDTIAEAANLLAAVFINDLRR
jgi:hypothetical protein